MKKIIIIDYNSGNIKSVFNAVNLIKNNNDILTVSSNPNHLKDASHIILPGVGSFSDCISNLENIPNLVTELKNQITIKKKRFLGICIGMQILAEYGYENNKCRGLSIVPGQVIALDSKNNKLKVPHIGWNNLEIKKNHSILKNIKEEDFYFVHSYKLVCNEEYIIATTNYGDKVTAIIAKDNIIATQFHPEKSSKVGLNFLRNFIYNEF